MTFAMMIPVVSCFLMVAAAVALFVERRLLLSAIGPLSFSLEERRPLQFVGIFLASPILVIVPAVRCFSPTVSASLSAVGVLLFTIAFRDILRAGISGAYARGIVWRGSFVAFDSITAVDRPDPYTLGISARRRRGKMIVSGAQEMVDAVSEIVEKNGSPLP